MNAIKKLTSLILILILTLSLGSYVFADDATDEIVNYTITADVNEDATVSFRYHIEWLVLESDELGPVSWIRVGMPNVRYSSYSSDSPTVSKLDTDSKFLNVYFDREYYEGETIDFDITFTCDYLYEVNGVSNGETVYYYSPAWFDGVATDNLTIRWNADKALSWSGGAHEKDGYLEWNTSLEAGGIYDISVTYSNDAFAFKQSSNTGGDTSSSSSDLLWTIGGILIPILFLGVFVLFIVLGIKAIKKSYKNNSGFADGQTETKVTRTKVVYYDTCPGCGAPREEGKETCQYCGRDLIKSEEVIKEENISDTDKEALKFNDSGVFHYGPDPNTFVRVNHVHVPIVNPVIMGTGMNRMASKFSGSSGSSHSSSCAHSSCACACACACAGGGRAGCTTKDFYSTRLKLKQLQRSDK